MARANRKRFLDFAVRLRTELVGDPLLVPPSLDGAIPPTARIRLRRGGLPPRMAGWCLGQRGVAAVTLWHTVWVGARTTLSAELLLHEFCHVQQFEADRAFPLRYVWECLVRGYAQNRFEIEARHFARVNARADGADASDPQSRTPSRG